MIANSITKLQTAVRCWLIRKNFVRDRKAAVTVQAWIRGEQARATVGREMQELVRKRKEKEAQEAEAARLVAEEKQKQLEEQALSVRLAHVCVLQGNILVPTCWYICRMLFVYSYHNDTVVMSRACDPQHQFCNRLWWRCIDV